MSIFIPDFHCSLFHKFIHFRQNSCPVFLCHLVPVCNLTQGIKVFPHSSPYELFSHVLSTLSISLSLYKHRIEIKESIKCLSELPVAHSQDDFLLGLLLAGLVVADVFPTANG